MKGDVAVWPRDRAGHFIKRDCPDCGCGKLQYEGDGYWRCDGLADPDDPTKELEACTYSHMGHDHAG